MKNQGITLVALIVTIVILLILAGVTIALLNGENGILSRTEKAVTSYQIESIKEVVSLKLANLNAGKWMDEGRKAVLKDLNELDDENSKNFDTEITLKNPVQDSDTSAVLVYAGHEIEVDSHFNIAKVDGAENIGTTGGNSGSASSGETGSGSGTNAGVIDSEEYRQMQATIAQLQKEVSELKTQSATKTELGTYATKTELNTIEENYATKEELKNASGQLKAVDTVLWTGSALATSGESIFLNNPWTGYDELITEWINENNTYYTTVTSVKELLSASSTVTVTFAHAYNGWLIRNSGDTFTVDGTSAMHLIKIKGRKYIE